MRIDFNNLPTDLQNPARSRAVYLNLELATECDGARCGLTSYDGDEMPPIQPAHWHLRIRGDGPPAGPSHVAVDFEPLVRRE